MTTNQYRRRKHRTSPHYRGPRRCDWNPAAPQLDPDWPVETRWPFKAAMCRRFGSLYHDRHRDHLRMLWRHKGEPKKVRKSPIRSAAHVRLARMLATRWDPITMETAGRYDAASQRIGRFYKLAELDLALGVSPWATERLLSDFAAAGAIDRRWDEDRGCVVTKLTYGFFELVGLTEEEVKRQREASGWQQVKQRRRAARTAKPSPALLGVVGAFPAMAPVLAQLATASEEDAADANALANLRERFRSMYPHESAEWVAEKARQTHEQRKAWDKKPAARPPRPPPKP